jgi:poly(beta-D-mannuronate) lyase
MRYSMKRSCPLLAIAVAILAFAPSAQAQTLAPPPGYSHAVEHKGGDSFDCPEMPAPFTGALDFPSKYEGSGKARDQLNEKSDAEYKARTRPITEMEKGVVRSIDKYMNTGNPGALKCAIDWYTAWADAAALLGPAANHTGRSLRKWSLGTLSGAWLRLQFSSSKPLAEYPQQTQKIEPWLGRIAERVLPEWPENDPINKINNHYYWAAWSVMAASVVTNRHDLFDWSVKMYGIFAEQVDADGFLPNELARQSRALGYNNYAIMPIAMMAAFGKANGVDLASAGHGALKRAAERTLQGVDDPRVFETKTGVRQVLEGFDEPNSKLAWLEPYCWTVGCTDAIGQKAASLRPMKNTRLGGNVTTSFGGMH